ncbi:indolepyruvate oxidoreductase subunit beta [Promethearchaeum syntrophicum]|uniref:Indolepyruvate oxidoreductase subunit beta n=1 Tax=Promethearchaeum syntrophicum TaxID=2594042 RepID=A0A5B9DEH6_9ARCH|nr:indolepyruvate oxidoreductase subunit beta [Candidatus Prometheoarchaeum syntrophicum]QEE17514.1 Indolepyruvate oxidoreductase subunit IorB [Candidatus Prometheoarchaeum syntrophicum]
MVKQLKIHITGMGGQGIGATSRIISRAAQLAGNTVMTMETHGLAQRGGVVVSDLAIGFDPSESPICSDGESDVLIALEALESVRSLPRLKPDGIVIVNSTIYQPLTVRIANGQVQSPTMEQIVKELHRWTKNVVQVDAFNDSIELGLSQTMNVILLGALARNLSILPFSKEHIIESIRLNIPRKYHEVNLLAFEKGFNYEVV